MKLHDDARVACDVEEERQMNKTLHILHIRRRHRPCLSNISLSCKNFNILHLVIPV